MKPSSEELDNLYNKQHLTTYQIADMLGYAQQTISEWLIKAGLDRRSKQPTRDELYAMYITEGLSCRQIATKTGFSPSGIKKWLKEYGIERRPTGGYGLLARGIEPPSREVLYHLIHFEHKSYQEIGKIYGVDKTAISYWMKKNDIPRPVAWDTRKKGNRPILPSREELVALYESGLSMNAIGDIYSVSGSTIYKLSLTYQIEIRLDGWGEGKRYLCQDGHMVRSVYEQHVDDWLFAHHIDHTYEPRLPWDRRYRADFLANGWYIEVWGVTNNDAYEQRRKQKCQQYQQQNAPLIELPIYFFSQQKRKLLERRLTKCLTTPLLTAP